MECGDVVDTSEKGEWRHLPGTCDHCVRVGVFLSFSLSLWASKLSVCMDMSMHLASRQ